MTRAIIVGNGTTRKNFDLNKLRNLIDEEFPSDPNVFFCGVAHRDVSDISVLKELSYNCTVEDYRREMLKEDGVVSDFLLYPKTSDDHYEDPKFHGRTTNLPRSNTGMFAMKQAILRGYVDLYILGFDSLIKDDTEQSISNMFEGKPETRASAADNPNRIRYLDWFCQHNMLCSFTFVFDKNYEFYDVAADNIKVISYERFEDEVI